MVCGPWGNPRHGRGPQDQVTALGNRGTEDPYIETGLSKWFEHPAIDHMWNIFKYQFTAAHTAL